jgi:hypothetical protein
VSTIKVDTYLTRGGVSEIAIDKLKGVSSAGSMLVVGEGGTTTTNLQQGLCKQWINFRGTSSLVTRDSFNTTSITDNGTGDYQVTIANDMSNDDYSVSGTMCYLETGSTSAARQGPAVNEHAVSSYQVYAGTNTTTVEDVEVLNLQTMGDLA